MIKFLREHRIEWGAICVLIMALVFSGQILCTVLSPAAHAHGPAIDAGRYPSPSVVLMPDMEWHLVLSGSYQPGPEAHHACFTEDLGSKTMRTCGEIQGTRE